MKAAYRNITCSPGSSFKASLFKDKEFHAVWHFHPQLELTNMISSTGIRYVGDSMNNFEEGDLVLVGSNLPHCWKTEGEQDNDVKCVIIQWDQELLEPWLDKQEFKPIKDLLYKSQRGIHFNTKMLPNIKEEMIELVDLKPFDRLLKLLKILNQLAITEQHIPLAGIGYSNNLSINESERVNQIHNFIKENYQRQVSLNEIADLVAMSKETFCRFFKKTFNKTFFTYLNEYKINLASKMLIDTDLSVSEIGFRIGYNNLTFFHRQFHKFMNMSPSKYRKAFKAIS